MTPGTVSAPALPLRRALGASATGPRESLRCSVSSHTASAATQAGSCLRSSLSGPVLKSLEPCRGQGAVSCVPEGWSLALRPVAPAAAFRGVITSP